MTILFQAHTGSVK